MKDLRLPRLPGGRSCRRAAAALAAAVLAALALAITGSGTALASPAVSSLPTPGCSANTVSDATWMRDLSLCIGGYKLSDIVIPGSHDSLTYSFDASPVNNLAITQNLDITGQLNDGIRSLDLRVLWNYTTAHGYGYYARHGALYSSWLMLPRIFSDIDSWALAPGHQDEVIRLGLSIDPGDAVPAPGFPAQDCQIFANALGGSMVTPSQLQHNFGTTDPAQVTLDQLWSLPDPKGAARVIMTNNQCMDAADPSAGQWPSNGGGFYANQCTAAGMLSPADQQDGIQKLDLQAARTRASEAGGGEPMGLGPPVTGGLYELDIQGTPQADCLKTPASMVPDETTVLAALQNAWLAEPSVRKNLNLVVGDFIDQVPFTADAIAMDERLGAGPGYEVAYQGNDGNLWWAGFGGNTGGAQPLMPGTSPAITTLPGGGYEMAYQAKGNGKLVVYGDAAKNGTGQEMMPGTSPSIAASPGGGFEVAYQGIDGHLWTWSFSGPTEYGLQLMMAGTSPAITTLPGGGYEIAFQASTGNLFVNGPGGNTDTGLGMAHGTSPSIAASPDVICQDHGTRALPRPRDHLAAAVSSWGVRRDPSS